MPEKPLLPDETDDGRVFLAPLTPEQALRGLLAVDPESDPVSEGEAGTGDDLESGPTQGSKRRKAPPPE